jgi:hypothetical protein
MNGVPRIIELPVVNDYRGRLSFVESSRHIPFEIRRVYYLYDVPGGEERGGHAHKNLHQFLIALSGSFVVTLDNSIDIKTFTLNRAYMGLYVPPYTWRLLNNFSSGSVCLVLASDYYIETDYIRDYESFLEEARKTRESNG